MSHEYKQQCVMTIEIATPEFGRESGRPDLFEHLHGSAFKRLMGKFVVIFLVHERGEAVEEIGSIAYRLLFMDIGLVLADRFEYSRWHAVARRAPASRGSQIVFRLKDVDVVRQSQDLCRAAAGEAGYF